MVAEADRGALARTTATVGELLEEWLAHASPGFSPKNAKETRGVLDRNLLPYLGNVPLSKLGAADLDFLFAACARPVGRRDGPSPRPRSVAPTASCTGRSARASGGAG